MISRTKVLTLIVFGLLFLNLSAQDGFENDPVANLPDDDRTFRFGLHFTPHLSWFKTNTTGYESGGSKMGFAYGISFEYFLSNNYLISSGVSILNTGGVLKYKGATSGLLTTFPADVEANYSLKYIDVPFTLKLRTNEIGYFTYYAQFGLKAGFNFGANVDFDYTYDDSVSPLAQNHSESIKNSKSDINFMNLYMVIGLGTEYNISGNTSAFVGLTFNNGFVNQMDVKEHVLDESGNALINSDGKAVFSEKDVNANLNYLALSIGIYF